MIIVLSPSKTLDFESAASVREFSQPRLLGEAAGLNKILRNYSAGELEKLMRISPALAELNARRNREFKTPFTLRNARPALLAFKGDVYEGMEIAAYSQEDFAFAQLHLRILSGLYGLLRPLDLMQPYRLEMGTKLKNPRGKNLYEFWGGRITELLNADMAGNKKPVLVNLASEEYFNSVQPQTLKGKCLQVTFKERHKGQLKVIGLHAKRARGLMADYAIRNRIADPDALKFFRSEGYGYKPDLSGKSEMVFVR